MTSAIVLVGAKHRGALVAVSYARSLRPDRLIVLHVAETDADKATFLARWDVEDVNVEVVVDPYRNLRGTVSRFVRDTDAEDDHDVVTVIIPEFVVHRWWEHLLHNQSALFLKGALLFHNNVNVLSVPYQIDQRRKTAPPEAADDTPVHMRSSECGDEAGDGDAEAVGVEG